MDWSADCVGRYVQNEVALRLLIDRGRCDYGVGILGCAEWGMAGGLSMRCFRGILVWVSFS